MQSFSHMFMPALFAAHRVDLPEEVDVVPHNVVGSHHQVVLLHQFTQPKNKNVHINFLGFYQQPDVLKRYVFTGIDNYVGHQL